MKNPKRIISLFLAFALSLTVLSIGAFTSYADTTFREGDFGFTLTSETSAAVSKYYGDSVNVILPETAGGRTVTGIYTRCFENSDIESVVIPRNYKSIGSFAFSGCQSLTSAELPSGLISIGIMAFNDCSSISNIDFSVCRNLEEISFAAFNNCTALETVCLPDSLTLLGENSFCRCSSLSLLTLPQGIGVIPEYAFYGCAIETLRFPEGVHTVGEGAFENNTMLKTLDIPQSVISIGVDCFKNDTLLTDIFVPETVTSIGNGAFYPMAENGAAVSCYTDSAAAQYFENKASNLTVVDKKIGDVNCDGLLTIDDVTAIQKYLARMISFNYRQLKYAEADGDGLISINDATKLQRILAHIE